MLDEFETYAVVYADHARAAIYQAVLGRMTEEKRLRGDIKNHVRKGGWSQQRYKRRRDKEIHNYCREIVSHLQEILERDSIRRVVLAGDRNLLQELESRMHPELRGKVVQILPMEGGKTPDELFLETLPLVGEEEKREEAWLQEAILRESARGGRACVGVEVTFDALKEKRVRWLLIGPLEEVSFRRCRECGWSHPAAVAACPQCGEAVYEQCAANELADLAFAAGSRVEFTSSPLGRIGGVGALLRW
jgi:peptide subunit release factor 1 (eRF1)